MIFYPSIFLDRTTRVKELLENVTLDNEEEIISLDVKNLHTNVPVDEAIEIALDALYKNTKPTLPVTTFRELMKIAVKNVEFIVSDRWYIQKDGVAMGASLSVILANLWMKKFEPIVQCDAEDVLKHLDCLCGSCNRKVTNNGYSIQCDKCDLWFQRKCTLLSIEQIKSIGDDHWFCVKCDSDRSGTLFARYVDDIIRVVRIDEIDSLVERLNKIHKNLDFTIERPSHGKIAFLDMLINRKDDVVSTEWYTKPTDTGTMLSFRALAPLSYKKNIISGNIHRVFNATSNWLHFDAGLRKAKSIWLKNQYPNQFCDKIVESTLNRLVGVSDPIDRPADTDKSKKPWFSMQYRGRISDDFKKKLLKIVPANVIFTTRKLRTFLPSLKSKFDDELKSSVVYQIVCPGCQSSYVGQTTRHLTTRINEHQRSTAPVSQHLSVCSPMSVFPQAKIIDSSRLPSKLLTLEALYIDKLKPSLNQREEFRQRHLTLKL